ncbi:hypothetical protein MP228_004982 [Amoeboaphelidium protococcarum]|nr:hypothetical protein MP228_005747 [Amoeboaphelidium protococcarum]KAI3650163.1 hypothetical protein MP228_004982 [Amoeboaphelidium protococcarum]
MQLIQDMQKKYKSCAFIALMAGVAVICLLQMIMISQNTARFYRNVQQCNVISLEPDAANLSQQNYAKQWLQQISKDFGSFRVKGRDKYSSVYCRQQNDESAQCVFANVGLEADKIVFYENPNDPVSFITNSIKYQFPGNMLGIRSGPERYYRQDTAIIIKRHPMPNDVVYVQSNVSYLFTPFWPQNQGHFLVDDLFGIFTNLLELGMFVDDIHLTIFKGCEEYFPGAAEDIGFCKDFFLNRTIGLTKVRPLFLRENPYKNWTADYMINDRYQKAYQSNRLVFQNMVAGHTTFALTHGSTNRAFQWKMFRDLFLYNTGLVPNARPQKHQITVIKKLGRRNILNFDEMLDETRKLGVDVYVYDPTQIGWMDQLRVMLNTTLLVTVPGGISFLSGFMHSQSGALIFDAWNITANSSYPLEGYWWENLGAFQLLSYAYETNEAVFPAGLTDYTKLTKSMRVQSGLPLEGVVRRQDMTPQAAELLVRFFSDIQLDIRRYSKVLCEAFTVADQNYDFKSRNSLSHCKKDRNLAL